MPDTTGGTPGRFQIFKQVIESISTDKDRLFVKEQELRDKIILCVDCSERDYSKLVGKRGCNVNAMEVLFALAAWRTEQKDGLVKISVPETSQRAPKEPFSFNPKWGEKNLKLLLLPMCELISGRGAVDVTNLTRESMLVRLTVYDYDGVTYRSENRGSETVSESSTETALERVFTAVAKANGRDVEIELTRRELPDTSGR